MYFGQSYGCYGHLVKRLARWQPRKSEVSLCHDDSWRSPTLLMALQKYKRTLQRFDGKVEVSTEHI